MRERWLKVRIDSRPNQRWLRRSSGFLLFIWTSILGRGRAQRMAPGRASWPKLPAGGKLPGDRRGNPGDFDPKREEPPRERRRGERVGRDGFPRERLARGRDVEGLQVRAAER